MKENWSIEACPNCASRRVISRRPRPTDTLFGWIRYVVDWVLGGAGADRASAIGNRGLYGATATTLEYGYSRNRLDLKVGLKTPDLFWRCPDCHKKGEIRDLAELEGDVSLLESMEKTITDEGGGVRGAISNQDNRRR